MTSSNRTQITSVREVTVGTTPGTPRMRLRRVNGETLQLVPTFAASNEMRSDRMASDIIRLGKQSSGDLPYDLIYPFPDSPNDSDLCSAFYNDFTNRATRFNDGMADSVITAVATSGEVVTCTTGTAFVAGQLVRLTGFGVTGNNVIAKCTTGSATVPAFVGAGLTDEAAPAAAARMKVVGFQGASGDITATSTGLGSTALDFTTLGLAVGQWVKIGGSATADKFATAALNGTARITAIGATALTLDHLPTGWTTDAGTSKTIKVWIGDQIKNGTTQVGQTIERGFLGQGTPNYFVHAGMVVAQANISMALNQPITLANTYQGMGGSVSTSPLDASPDASLVLASFPPFVTRVHVARVTEAGTTIASPNFLRGMTIVINNNSTMIEAIDAETAQGITGHAVDVTGTAEFYFGNNALLTKYLAGTPTSLSTYAYNSLSGQALIFAIPRVIFAGDGSPNASGRNVDVMLPLSWTASKDETVTGAMITLDRFEYVEN
jgi:hypothetical protein